MSTMLNLDNVNYTVGDGPGRTQALDNVSLSVEAGEMVAIIGPSGAGKSSLLAVAGGLAVPDDGRVVVAGEDLTALGTARRGHARRLAAFRRKHLGYVFQSGNLIPALNAADQLRLVSKISPGTPAAEPLELLRAVGLSEKAKRKPRELSGGERQRVGIARALVNSPSVLLVDEPTAALDRARSQDIVALLAQQAKEHQTAVLMVTHDHDVLHHCDRILTMVDGRLEAA